MVNVPQEVPPEVRIFIPQITGFTIRSPPAAGDAALRRNPQTGIAIRGPCAPEQKRSVRSAPVRQTNERPHPDMPGPVQSPKSAPNPQARPISAVGHASVNVRPANSAESGRLHLAQAWPFTDVSVNIVVSSHTSG